MSEKKEVDINVNISIDVSGHGKVGVNTSTHLDTGKVETDMSVAQLAYLCGIFYDLGKITKNYL